MQVAANRKPTGKPTTTFGALKWMINPLLNVFLGGQGYPVGLPRSLHMLGQNSLPSGKREQKTDGKITILNGFQSAISMAIFNSHVTNYQRVAQRRNFSENCSHFS